MASLSTLAGFAGTFDSSAAASGRGASFGQKLGQLLNHNPRRQSLEVAERQVVQLPRQAPNAAVASNSTSLGQGLLLDPDFGRSSRQGRVSPLQDVTVRPCLRVPVGRCLNSVAPPRRRTAPRRHNSPYTSILRSDWGPDRAMRPDRRGSRRPRHPAHC